MTFVVLFSPESGAQLAFGIAIWPVSGGQKWFSHSAHVRLDTTTHENMLSHFQASLSVKPTAYRAAF